jgi:hypothetical protein
MWEGNHFHKCLSHIFGFIHNFLYFKNISTLLETMIFIIIKK